jgi:hypothetical protein
MNLAKMQLSLARKTAPDLDPRRRATRHHFFGGGFALKFGQTAERNVVRPLQGLEPRPALQPGVDGEGRRDRQRGR